MRAPQYRGALSTNGTGRGKSIAPTSVRSEGDRDPMTAEPTRASAVVASVLLVAVVMQQNAVADQTRGRVLAEQQCSECHGVKRGERSPLVGVSSFTEIAAEPPIADDGLRVFLKTSHPRMPNLMIKPDDIDDLVSYIASLR